MKDGRDGFQMLPKCQVLVSLFNLILSEKTSFYLIFLNLLLDKRGRWTTVVYYR